MHKLLKLGSCKYDILNEFKLQRKHQILKKNWQSFPYNQYAGKFSQPIKISHLKKQPKNISFISFQHTKSFQRYSTSFTSHLQIIYNIIYIFQVVGLPGLYIGPSTYKIKSKSSSTHISFSLHAPTQVTQLSILRLIFSFSFRTSGLGEFFHKMVRPACLKIYHL